MLFLRGLNITENKVALENSIKLAYDNAKISCKM